MDHKYALYFIFHVSLRNNTQIIDLLRWSISYTYSYTHQNFSLSHSQSEICILHADIQVAILSVHFLCIWNIKMIIRTSFPLPLLYFSIIWNSQTKTKYFHFRNFGWLTKITHIAEEGVYLKRPKRLFDIYGLVLSL